VCAAHPKVVDDEAQLRYAAGMKNPFAFGVSGLSRGSAVLVLLVALAGCSGISVGIGLPIGGFGGVGVSVGSDGRVSGSLGVGTGGVSMGVGGTAQLPKPSETAASAPLK
jgi:hypothetical protein